MSAFRALPIGSLGKAGLKVLALERKGVAGGGLSTLEDPRYPGFLHNTHAYFQRAITTMPASYFFLASPYG
jgi:phytoene dehydrogenase-like protein